MLTKLRNPTAFLNLIVSVFIFGTLFPTLRAFAIGSSESASFFEYLVSAIPDLLIILLVLISVQIRKEKTGSYLYKFSTSDFILLGILLFNLVFGSIISADIKLIVYAIRMTYLPIVLFFVARNMEGIWEDEVVWKKVYLLMIWLGITAIIGLVLYFFFSEFEDYLKDIVHANKGHYFIERLNSIYHAGTLNGAYMAVAGVFFFLLNSYRLNFRNFPIIAAISGSLLLSVSRGGIIGFIIATLLSIGFIRKWKNCLIVYLFILSSCIAIASSAGFTFSNIKWVFQSSANTAMMDKSVSRVKLWDSAFEDMADRPFGYGLGKSGWIAYRFLKESEEESAFAATDGWFLKQANETGIIGLFGFLVFFGYFLVRLAKNFRLFEFDSLFFVFILILQVLLMCIVSNVLDYFTFNGIFWFFIGVAENKMRQQAAFLLQNKDIQN